MPAPATHSTTPSPDPTADAKQAVLTAYKGMVDAEVKALNTNSLANSDIEKYTEDKALAGAKDSLFQDMQGNIVFKGKPSYTIQNVSVDLAPTPHTAQVTVCWDNKNWTPVNKSTGKSATAPGQPQRYVMTESLRTIGNRWVVIDGTTERGKAC
jgi:hypothetical protein